VYGFWAGQAGWNMGVTMRRLVLFDIDGTLVNTGRAGADAMTMAFAELYRITDGFAGIRMSGKTDRLILQEALDNHRVPLEDGAFDVFHERYLFHLHHTLQEPARPRRLMPGLPHLLETLGARADVLLGLLTGNVARGAQLKLESFDLWQYFRLGAYGSDASDRNALVPVAQSRARALGHDFSPAQIVVIGDTPRDIRCAQVHGALAVAVATGSYSLAELLQHGPDHCFHDLGDMQAVLSVLTAHDQGEGT
jgi:phosphoglycolate phosphatase-like HAD superfamily hydrolase